MGTSTAPVTAFPPNGFGIHDMIGNVWEWTADCYSPKHQAGTPKVCCIPANPRGASEETSYDPCQPDIRSAQGLEGRLTFVRSELLPPLPAAARHPQPTDTSTSHVGFRCVIRPGRKV